MSIDPSRFVTPLLLIFVWGATGAAVAAPPDRKACVEFLTRELDENHVDRSGIDLAAHCEEFASQVRAGASGAEAGRWLGRRLRDLLFGFAPEGSRHDPRARYRLPFEVWIPRLVPQGPNGATHRTPEDRHAYDFLMPIGTPVVAARSGTVAAVRDGATARNVSDPEGETGNTVMVLHDDGTFAVYTHLAPGIPVRQGEAVEAGRRIGRSGSTGYSRAPHLHFVVRRRTRLGEVLAVAIRFGPPGSKGYTLEPGNHYGTSPPSRRELHVRNGNSRVKAEAPISLRKGASTRLTVERVEADGTVTDVTDSKRIRFENMTTWSLTVTPSGQVIGKAAEGWADGYLEKQLPWLDRNSGLVYVFHGLPRDPDFGFSQVPVSLKP